MIIMQMNQGASLLSNNLKTLINKIKNLFSFYSNDGISKINQRLLNKTIEEVIYEYNLIMRKHKLINGHCEKTSQAYFCYLVFTIIFPIIILFLDPKEILLISVNLTNYLLTLSILLLPSFYYNSTYFIRSVSKFYL